LRLCHALPARELLPPHHASLSSFPIKTLKQSSPLMPSNPSVSAIVAPISLPP
jgi:hypothetical protein